MSTDPLNPDESELSVIKPTSAQLRDERGMSGLPGAVAGGGWIYDERFPELVGLEGRKTYRKLAEDPVISAALYAIEQLVRHVSWRVEPAADAPKSAAEKAAEFVEGALFEDMDVPFAEVVADATSMLTYGFAIQEIVFKRRKGAQRDIVASSSFDDEYFGVARLAPRAQTTISRWVYGKGSDRVIGVEQTLPDAPLDRANAYGSVIIPYWKTLHYRTTAARSNPEGRAITRPAYVSWRRKQELEQVEGRLMSRAAGIVELRVPGRIMRANATPEEKAVFTAYQQAAERLAQERQGSLVLPSDKAPEGQYLYELNYRTTDSRRASEILASIERYDRRIATTMLADFLLIGHEKVGSFALANSKEGVFARSVASLLQAIADQFNRVLLPLLWEVNTFDPALRPKLVPGELEERDLEATASFLSSLAGAGMPLFPDDATESHLREMVGLPTKSETSQAQAQTSDANRDEQKANAQETKDAKTKTRDEEKAKAKPTTTTTAAQDDDA